jgi:hypothetical protein
MMTCVNVQGRGVVSVSAERRRVLEELPLPLAPQLDWLQRAAHEHTARTQVSNQHHHHQHLPHPHHGTTTTTTITTTTTMTDSTNSSLSCNARHDLFVGLLWRLQGISPPPPSSSSPTHTEDAPHALPHAV